MKKYLFFALVTIFLAVGSAHAQSGPMVVDIPFDFFAGDVVLHAGKYTVRALGLTNDSVLLRSADLKQAVLLSPSALEAKRSSGGRLIFKVEGSRHYLWKIWTPGDDRGHELPVSFHEKKLATATKGSPVVSIASIGPIVSLPRS